MDNRDVVSFLKASADARGMQLVDFIVTAEIGDPRKAALLDNRASSLDKYSSGTDDYRLDLATAKEAVEAGVQTQGTLATTEEIVRTTGVDPAVANAAQMQVAQTIVAAGGSVAAPGGVAATGVTGAGAAAMAGGAGVAPAPAAIMPPMGAAAPVDPSMAPMTDPNTAPAAAPAPGAPAPAADPMAAAPPAPGAAPAAGAPAALPADPTQKAASQRVDPEAGLKYVLDNWGAKHSASDVVITDREEPTTGPPSPREAAVAPAEGATEAPVGSGTYELSASERAVADAISTNQGTTTTDDADAEANKRPDIDGRVNTPVEAASTKGALTSTAPVKGTKEGTLATPSTQPSEQESTKRSADDDMAAIIRRAAADSVKASSSVMVATGGRGSREVVGGDTAFGGGPSDSLSNSEKKAYSFVRSTIEREGKAPEVTDVMSETGVSFDDAKTGIYHASNG